MLGTYFSGAFLAREFHAAIPVLGSAVFLAGLFAFLGLVVGSAMGTASVPSLGSYCLRPPTAIALLSTGILVSMAHASVSISTPVSLT
jgi:hypothetical protein